MRPTPEDVRRAAALARLELADGEAERLAAQLGDILERIDRLEDPDGPEPGAPAPESTAGGPSGAYRGDVPGAGLRADAPSIDALAADPGSFAPEWVEGFFTVPRLASHGGSGGREEAS